MSMLNYQFGTAATADFQDKTWTFQMPESFTVMAGDFAIIPKSEYDKIMNLLDRAGDLVGHPMTNHSSSIEMACDNWRDEYQDLTS